jgi:hypothetical protein
MARAVSKARSENKSRRRNVTLDKTYDKYFRRFVEDGGGQWVGIQECEGRDYDLILFNSPKTGSTLALRTTEVTAQRVWESIHESNKLFSKARHHG